MAKHEPLKVVLVDIDGTLIDSNDAHASSWVDTFLEQNYRADFDEVRRLIGKGGDKLIPEITGLRKDSPEGTALNERRSRIFKKRYLPKIRPFQGALPLLERMRRDGLRLVVATSAAEDELTPLLEIAGATHVFEKATSAADVERSKPDPDVVMAALEKARCRPAEAIMLGDTPYDVVAASKAGVRCVALRSGGWKDDELAGATSTYDDVAHLLREYDTSIFAKRGEE
jgi:HAD superfamily hydrolase (TIGR01509 family)